MNTGKRLIRAVSSRGGLYLQMSFSRCWGRCGEFHIEHMEIYEDYTIIITGAVRETPPDREKLRQALRISVKLEYSNHLKLTFSPWVVRGIKRR